MLVYFDSCVFISWLKNDKDSQSIIDIIHNAELGKCQILTSAIGVAEIWPNSQYLPDRHEQYHNMLLSRFMVMPVDFITAKESVKVVNALNALNKGGSRRDIKTPDAIHIATAIRKKADYLCTFDEGILAYAQDINSLANNAMKTIKPPLPMSQSLLPLL